ncbi:MAG: hypothetical protein GX345_08365 [Clostridiales bacterium]|nr:hypothetical protein [Clostridiales bacterium]
MKNMHFKETGKFKLSKKILGVILVAALIVSAVGVGLTTFDKSFETPKKQAIEQFDPSVYRRPSPNVTLDATDVIRVGASGTTTMGPGNTIKKVTQSGVPEITAGSFQSQALAGETAYWPTVSFSSDKAVTITSIVLSGTGVSASATLTGGSLNNSQSATWEIRSGTAPAGSLMKIDIEYKYTWNNPYTGIDVTDEYVTTTYSFVENIIFPAGAWVWAAAGGSAEKSADSNYISRILGRGVYGEQISLSSGSGDYRSGYVDLAHSDQFVAVTGSDFTRVSVRVDPPRQSAGDRELANGVSPYPGDNHRGKATIYRDSSVSSLEDNNVRMHFLIHKAIRYQSGDLTWETVHTRDGNATYSGSTDNDLGVSGPTSWAALAPTGPKDGTVSSGGGFKTAGMQTTSNFQGTGAAGTYTIINQWTGKGDTEGTGNDINWIQHYAAQLIEIVVVDKGSLRTNLNDKIGTDLKTVTGAKKVTTIKTANGTDVSNGGITNTAKGKNPQEWYYSSGWSNYETAYKNAWEAVNNPRKTQAEINSVSTNLNSHYSNLTLAGANYNSSTVEYLDTGLGNTYYRSTVKPLDTSLTAIANGDSSYNAKLAHWKQDQDYFTPTSKNSLNLAITAATNAKNSNYNVLYQPYLDHCAQELQLAVENLEYKQNNLVFDSNTGSGYMAAQTIQAGSSATLKANSFTKTGHIFTGWNTKADGSGTAYADKVNFNMGTDGITLYAQWQNNSFTISFNSNGGSSVPSVTEDYGTQIAPPQTPTKTGHSFAGWYSDSGLTTAVTWPYTVTEDTTLHAKWTVNQYTISFNANGGDGSMSNQFIDYNSTATLNENNYSRTGYSFNAWNTKADGSGDSYADKASYGPMDTANVTLYAQWSPKEYTITFDSAGGSSVDSITQIFGSALTAPAAPTKAGYIFSGWHPQVPTYMPAQDLVCVAQWSSNQHTISFMTNGGSMVDPITDDDGKVVSQPTAPTREGYSFVGWFTDEELSQAVSWPHTIGTNVTFYAKWTPNTYTINYDGNGSDSGSTVSSGHNYNAPQALTANEFSKTGYSFAGWNTAADGSGTDYNDQQLVMNLSQTSGSSSTLYAQWAPNYYTVAFHSKGGSAVDSITNVLGTQISEPSQPTRTGYDFAGWYEDDQYSQALTWPYTISSSNVIFYAKWDPANDYTITFDANGGQGGASLEVRQGEMPIPPTVRRVGYAFKGWSPEIVQATQDTTYTAQWAETSMEIKSLEDNKIAVTITGFSEDYSYQIWSYQKITSDLILDDEADIPANQWVLSMPYTKGAMGTLEDDKLVFIIDKFTSPNENYTVALRIADENGDYIFELNNSYTAEDLDIAVITKVLVDGEYVKGSAQDDSDPYSEIRLVKDIADGSTTIKVVGNFEDLTYTATVLDMAEDLTPVNGNEFVWNISGLEPRSYTVKVTASNDNSSDERTLHFTLYSLDEEVEYAEIDELEITGGGVISNLYNIITTNIGIKPTSNKVGHFYYRIGEPGRKAPINSDKSYNDAQLDQDMDAYGYYQLTGLVNRDSGLATPGGWDDGIIKHFNIKRSSDPSSLTVEVNGNGGHSFTLNKGLPITIVAEASIAGIGSESVEYSFWRYDAKGYILVKDWSADNFLTWTPGKVGDYNIQVRAKGELAKSYEVSKSIAVSIVDPDESKAQGVVITINEEGLNANAKARVPIMIKANATGSDGDDLLYKFYIHDEFMLTRQLRNYSPSGDVLWTPRKAGTYQIMVLVKNQVSYGKYDAIKRVTVTVE